MRKIKFRAWDSKENRWKYPVWDITNDLNKNSQNYLISQFTGLQDKNGIDIYEGDIVEVWGGEQAQGFWEISIRGQFVFSYNAFLIKDKKDIHYDPSMFDATIQIIGNIYENPEYLCLQNSNC